MGGEDDEGSLEYTPTWVIAVVCFVIIAISFAMERLLHHLGDALKEKQQKPLYEALLKVKEELMLLGFISLLLTAFQSAISKICMSKDLRKDMLPCRVNHDDDGEARHNGSKLGIYFASTVSDGTRRLLSADSSNAARYCSSQNKVPLMSLSVHIRNAELEKKFIHVQQHDFIKHRFQGFGKRSVPLSWYLWAFVIIFLLLNVNGLYTYFWIAFIPFILLLTVGTKLEHVITSLAHDVAEKHVAIEGELVVRPSDELFWFDNPHLVLRLIHFILFQNAFEIAFFFWIWVQFGFESCLIDKLYYILPKLTIGMFVQVVCSYSTLPLYAIVAQMGSSFNKAIFDDHVQASLLGWAKKVKKKQALKLATQAKPSERPFMSMQMKDDAKSEASTAKEDDPEKGSDEAC
ncbi:MLO-like protein 13 [Hibiscus syriacus]|uniref:MLO-like protein n=1 Tax=Hibiscus syriacus TaxID=106335 RepID=A0A6A3BXL1_HIBSY|nr:MLO-like protein 13 [Hibiscus syriacus]